jgi:hypothetical protein
LGGASLALCLTLALRVGPAGAEEEPGVEVGGEVPSYLSLELDAEGGSAGNCTMHLGADVTASTPGAQLSLTSAGGLGRDPLEAAAEGDPFQPFAGPFGASLASWTQPIGDTAVSLRFRCAGSQKDASSELLYLTLSAQTP